MIYEKELLIGPVSPFFGLKTQFPHLAWRHSKEHYANLMMQIFVVQGLFGRQTKNCNLLPTLFFNFKNELWL